MKYIKSEHTELKRTFSDLLPRDIVSFLNSGGGTIYIGAEKDGSITGVDDFDQMLRKIAGMIETQIIPDSRELVSLGTRYEKGKYAVKISVQPGSALFYVRGRGRSAAGHYRCAGSTSCAMTEAKIHRSQKNYLPYGADIAELPGHIENPSFHILKILLDGKVAVASDASFEQELKLRTSDGRYNLLSDLLSDRNELSIKVVRFAGRSKDCDILQQKEFGGRCLILAMQRAYEFCAEVLNETAVSFECGVRHDHQLFSRAAFREAWFNACLHNSWADGTLPVIHVFTDRLEIISRGGLPPIISSEEFLQGVSYPVNKWLAGIFMRLNLMSQAGFGVPFVVKNYGRDAYRFTADSISVTIPFAWETGAGFSGKNSGKCNTETSETVSLTMESPDIHPCRTNCQNQAECLQQTQVIPVLLHAFSCGQIYCTLR